MIDPVDFLALMRLMGGFALALGLVAATAWALGRRLLEVSRLAAQDPLERLALAFTLGLAALAHALGLLGLVGGLSRPAVLALGLAIHVWNHAGWRRGLAAWRLAATRPGNPAAWPIAALLLATPFVAPALYPDTAFDATMYHLPFARAFVATGRLPFLADLRFPVFPQAAEVLFAATMLLGPDVAARGVGVLCLAVTAAWLVAWGRRAFPEAPRAGLLAAAMLLGNPLVAYLAAVCHVEGPLTLFATGALFAAERWRASADRRWVVISAALAASAADVKYLGLYVLAVVALLVMAPRGGATRRGARCRVAALFAAVAIAALAPWYGRIWLATGNPLFPYATSVFGANPWQAGAEPAVSLLERLLRAVRLPWDMVFSRRALSWLPPLSPVYALALPLAVIAAVRDARLRGWLGITAAYALCCSWLPRNSGYLVMVLPLASLASAGTIVTWTATRAWARRLTRVLLIACVAPGWAYGLFTVARNGALPVDAAARERYLSRSLPLHAAIAWLDRTHGSDYSLWALEAERMVDFAAGRFQGDWVGPASYARVIAASGDAAALARELRALGADHLLVPAAKTLRLPIDDDPEAAWFFERVYGDANATVYALRRDAAAPAAVE